MPPARRTAPELRQALDLARQLPEAEQRFVAAAMRSSMNEISRFAPGPGDVMEEIMISCLDGPVSESHFTQFRPQLRRDLPIAVSRHFLDSYRRLDAEAKYSLRKYLRAWIDDPEDGALLVRPFRSDSRFKWIHLGNLATAVLSVSGPQPLWAALFRITHQRASLVGAPLAKVSTNSKASARLRAYLDAI